MTSTKRRIVLVCMTVVMMGLAMAGTVSDTDDDWWKWCAGCIPSTSN
ncbi:hypothetical protein Lfu02_12630 [Longispora fulva]|uniref:Uncharacterized protein n=1 Tax=Longispora fulva TaxID=619741 RepID=A0A8J7KN63_9ACTN|nr:hypothetical protein [Longispora fulva]MBG6134877.1 hypothetical protein [Longispora fulva]GIG56891.1 hypothetical protein Lfu02_12630 [Longispora fulva]